MKKEILNKIVQDIINEGKIEFSLDVSFDNKKESDKIFKQAKRHAIKVRRHEGKYSEEEWFFTVKDRKSGEKIINMIYGPENSGRDSNAFFLGLED